MRKKYTKYAIDPDFRMLARNIPYNIGVIEITDIVQSLLIKITPIPRGISSRKYTIKGYKDLDVPVTVFEPEHIKENMPCLLYIHGGAFSYKASPHHKKIACMYAKMANCRVVFPDYHLMPKYLFPAAYGDILSVYNWMCTNTSELRIDINRIAVGGDSAGGTLSIMLCNSIEKYHLNMPCLQMLIYPATDATMSTPSMKKYTDTPFWNSVNTKKMWSVYLKNASVESKRLASPLHNKLPNKIPYTYIETAEFDCLHDEGVLYAQKLKKAGAAVELHETKGTIHGYDNVMSSAITQESVTKRIKLLKRVFTQ